MSSVCLVFSSFYSFHRIWVKQVVNLLVLYHHFAYLQHINANNFQERMIFNNELYHLYLHWGPGHPPAKRGPSLESIYRVSLTVTVDLCEG